MLVHLSGLDKFVYLVVEVFDLRAELVVLALQVACDLLVFLGFEALKALFYLFAREYLGVFYLLHCLLLRLERTADSTHDFITKKQAK